MLGDEGVLRRVAWSELFPWLILARCFRLAIRFRALALAAAAILATLVGWALLGLVLSDGSGTTSPAPSLGQYPWQALDTLVPDQPFAAPRPRHLDNPLGVPPPVPVFRAWGPLVLAWEQLSRPFYQMFSEGVTFGQVFFLGLCGLWALLVWAFFGAAITRSAAIELAARERIGWTAMVRHAASKWLSYVGAVLLPLAAVLAAVCLSALLGLFLRVGPGILVASLVWPLMLLGWTLATALLLGLLVGWPLLWPVISSEGSDSFDAVSRTYNYLFSRPLQALFYVLVASVLGLLGWLLVSNFAAAVIYLSYWAAGWGAGESVNAIRDGAELGFLGGSGATLIRFWVVCVKLLAVGFLYSYLWTTAEAIYLLLRRDVDAREMDEVFMEDEGHEVASLPPLKPDASGFPEVAEAENGEAAGK